MTFRWRIHICSNLAFIVSNLWNWKDQKKVDKFEWRRLKYQKTPSLIYNTSLANFKTKLHVIWVVICYLSIGLQNCKILLLTNISKDTLINIWRIFYSKIGQHCLDNSIKLGGPDVVVQVDKTKINYNVKNHRGRPVPPCWVFYIVDTSNRPALGFCCIVSDRSSNTLIDIISNVVVQGSIICSDEWASYVLLGRNQDLSIEPFAINII